MMVVMNEQLCFAFSTLCRSMAVVFGRREKAKASKKGSSETSKQPAREKPLEVEEGCLNNTCIITIHYNFSFHLLCGFIAERCFFGDLFAAWPGGSRSTLPRGAQAMRNIRKAKDLS